MLWWQDAVDAATQPDRRTELQHRLLDYNEDDVRAALHIREWMDAHATTLRPVDRP